ncbi:amidohydrolase family protein [Pararhodobacter aggregans]|uniref:amidohydrolase family protein n=1 Tax=Pararhodobacter aggregans TaxID=404875 RepID=UPI003A951A57
MDAKPIPAARPLPVQEIDVFTDTREVLRHAQQGAQKRGFQDWLICDVDAHHVETVNWHEMVRYIEDPVIRHQAMLFHQEKTGGAPYGLNGDAGLKYQDVGGRIPHQAGVREPVDDKSVHRDVTLTRRAMQALGIDYMVLFPTPMLTLGLHPQPEMEVHLSRAYNHWLIDNVLKADSRIKTLAYLPFNTPREAEAMIGEFADQPGVIGFCVPSVRHKALHHNDYMRCYAMLQELGKPVAFHAAYHWQDPSLATVNRFLGMHALGFAWCNMVHMTNWILNGIPERFPKLKSIWVESGLAWVPFLMQRLDDQYLMRPSEAPQLKRLPSEYMREHCWYTTQPMETVNMKALQVTLEMINAESQLLFASDWPHFDFDLPQEIYDLPFLSEQAKRNILGLNAAKLFGLDPRPVKSL